MPMQSQAQSRLMHAVAAGTAETDIPQSVGQKFVAESHGQKVGKLPQHKRPKHGPFTLSKERRK